MAEYRVPELDLSTRIGIGLEMLLDIPDREWGRVTDLAQEYGVSRMLLYKIRNQKAATHSVWRSDRGLIEGDCPSYGYGIPYDTSLTNPLVATDIDMNGEEHNYQGGALTSIEQAEPNGIFASKNTAATWVMCLGEAGNIEPVYVETKVTVYPGPVKVDYESKRPFTKLCLIVKLN